MQIRPFLAKDAPALATLFHAAIHRIAALHYTPEQIQAWAPGVPDAGRFLARGTDGRTLLVAADDNDEPLAYGDLEADGHIDHLYCRPDAAGTGETAKLFEALEAIAASQGIARLYTEASEPARRFFARQGFELIARRDFEIRGVRIHNYSMEKRL